MPRYANARELRKVEAGAARLRETHRDPTPIEELQKLINPDEIDHMNWNELITIQGEMIKFAQKHRPNPTKPDEEELYNLIGFLFNCIQMRFHKLRAKPSEPVTSLRRVETPKKKSVGRRKKGEPRRDPAKTGSAKKNGRKGRKEK